MCHILRVNQKKIVVSFGYMFEEEDKMQRILESCGEKNLSDAVIVSVGKVFVFWT